jgi:hypothetical protein
MALKKTSQLMNLGSTIDLVDGTPANITISLPLNSLDREVFVVTDIVMDYEPIEVPQLPGQDVSLLASVNKSNTTVQTINNPNAIAALRVQVTTTPVGNGLQETFSPKAFSSGTQQDFLSVIATNDYVLTGSYASTGGGAANRGVFVRITGYRAQATSDVYAALVTEELNSQF